MFRSFQVLWKDGSIMREVVQRLAQMVEDGEYLFTRAWEAALGQAVLEKTEPTIKERDKAVNRGEREVRRMLVEHLAINPGQDVSGCLAVMIMAKDLERVGDHGRNIFNLVATADADVSGFQFFGRLDELQRRIGGCFPKLQRAILDSSEPVAREILSQYQDLKKEIKALQREILAAELGTREAVVTTLLVRYLMRINAHIGNVASGVIFPLENIDFVSRGLKQEEKDR